MNHWKRALIASVVSSFAVACLPPPRGPVELTSARIPSPSDVTLAEREINQGDLPRALATAEHVASRWPGDPWARYDRAVALEEEGELTAAIDEFRQAESRFAGVDANGKALSIYGRAHALASAGRCLEARTAYDQYATFVRAGAPEKAEMAIRYADDCVRPIAIDPVAAAVASAVVAGEYAGALAIAPDGGGAWLFYNRGVAAEALHRTDDAVASFRSAERAFDESQLRERSIAIYGRARALADALRCPEASAAFDEYAALVRPTRPHDAELALTYARDCHGPFRW